MSAINGDKARFHRRRKMKVHRRVRNNAMFLTLQRQAPTSDAGFKKEPTSANQPKERRP